ILASSMDRSYNPDSKKRFKFQRNPIQPPQRADKVRENGRRQEHDVSSSIGDSTRQYSPKKIPARMPAKPPMLTRTPRLGVFMDSFCSDLDRFENALASRDGHPARTPNPSSHAPI